MTDSHHEESFWRKYIFSIDHKVIGIQYGIMSLLFLLLGFGLMLVMRWQLAYPDQPLPLLGWRLSPDMYNSFGAMHGTIMIFLGVVPVITGAFGNYLVPLQVGACDMAFPKLNMASFWCYFVGGIVMLSGFLLPGGAASSGWTSYPPLSVDASTGQAVWLIGMVFLITSSLLGGANIIVTIMINIKFKITYYLLLRTGIINIANSNNGDKKIERKDNHHGDSLYLIDCCLLDFTLYMYI